eukprot:464276_1
MKQIVNKIPSETRRLYQFWCENVDAVEFYEVNDMDSLLAYVRETYPFPNTLQPVLNKIKNIVQRWRERPISEKLAEADPLTLPDFHNAIIDWN